MATSASDLYLHDTYYVVSRPLYAIWPLLLCLVLAAAISIVGYMHTEHFIRSVVPTTGNSSNWESPPNDA